MCTYCLTVAVYLAGVRVCFPEKYKESPVSVSAPTGLQSVCPAAL